MKVCIDPGHGMSNRTRNVFDTGATHTENGVRFEEAAIALKYGLSLKDVFRSRGQEVFMTRDDDTDHAPVGERAGNAERAGCDFFVSLHLNDDDNDDAHGLEVLFRGNDDVPLATTMQNALIKTTGLRDRGIKNRTDLAVLKFNGKAILIELGFIANDTDRNELLNPATRSAVCETIADVILGGAVPAALKPLPAHIASAAPLEGVATVPTARVTPPPGQTLNVRRAPRANAAIVGEVTAGSIVEIHGESGIWRKIAAAAERWVSSRFLTPIPAAGGPSAGGVEQVLQIAANSDIARFDWPQRGVAPIGYIKGMALTFARVLCKLKNGNPATIEMAKANTGDAARDVLAHYQAQYAALGLDNSVAGTDTLRHLFALMIGLGMRESSGEHCCGRDTGANNFGANTAEAGLFQTSFNARTSSPLLVPLFEEYLANPAGFLEVFSQGVTCSPSNWENHGQGPGREYQRLSKVCPAFHTEFTAVALRNVRNHWGPINNRAAKIMPDADAMLREVQAVVDVGGVCPV